VFSILVVVMVLLSIPTQTMQISLLTNQSISKRILNNETNNNTQAIVNELRKMRGILEGSRPRQVILTIVSFFVAIAFTVFGVQLAFRPEKTEIKYFRVAILSLIIPVTVLLIAHIVSNILGIRGFGFITTNIWLFASLMLLIPIFTLITLVILHRIAKER
jgi:hypothetical protein